MTATMTRPMFRTIENHAGWEIDEIYADCGPMEFSDDELEIMWHEFDRNMWKLTYIDTDAEGHLKVTLSEDWQFWPEGTHVIDIAEWFDEEYSEGWETLKRNTKSRFFFEDIGL